MSPYALSLSMLAMAILLHVSPGPGSVRAQEAGPSGSFTILHTNDFHGRHLPFEAAPGNSTSQTGDPGQNAYEFEREGMVGGFAYLADAVGEIRRERGDDAVILLDGGDSFSDDLLGNLTRGEAMIQFMNALGYDFAALGNHDFDYGLERTRELQQLASFPMRAANIREKTTGEPVFGPAITVIEAGGLRVGILALGYYNTPLTTDPENIQGLQFTNGVEEARRLVPELRKIADIVVVLSHQGTEVDEILAEEVEGIDLIVGGHSHDLFTRHDRTWMVQALSDGASLGEVRIRVEEGRLAEVEGTNHILWNDRYEPDPHLEALIHRTRAPHREKLEEAIGVAGEQIGRQYKSESPFDRLAGDILRQEVGAEIAFLPGVGYGVSLQPGPIRREALYTLMPHPATLVTLELTGNQIREILEQSATNQEPADPLDKVGGLVQTSGMRWTIDLSRPTGERISSVAVGDEPLAPDRRYRVVTHSGMLSGIHGYTTFEQGSDIQKSERRVVDILEERFHAMKMIWAPATGDIELVKP